MAVFDLNCSCHVWEISFKYWTDIFWDLDSLLCNKLFSWPCTLTFYFFPTKVRPNSSNQPSQAGRLVLLSLWAYNCQRLELCHVMSAPKSMEPHQTSTSCSRGLGLPMLRRGKRKTTVNPRVVLGHRRRCWWIRKVPTKVRCFDRWGLGGPAGPRFCPDPHVAFSGNSFGFIHSRPRGPGVSCRFIPS